PDPLPARRRQASSPVYSSPALSWEERSQSCPVAARPLAIGAAIGAEGVDRTDVHSFRGGRAHQCDIAADTKNLTAVLATAPQFHRVTMLARLLTYACDGSTLGAAESVSCGAAGTCG